MDFDNVVSFSRVSDAWLVTLRDPETKRLEMHRLEDDGGRMRARVTFEEARRVAEVMQLEADYIGDENRVRVGLPWERLGPESA